MIFHNATLCSSLFIIPTRSNLFSASVRRKKRVANEVVPSKSPYHNPREFSVSDFETDAFLLRSQSRKRVPFRRRRANRVVGRVSRLRTLGRW